MVKLAFHPNTATEQTIAAIEDARRYAEDNGVEIIELTDAEHLAIDDVILVKQVSAAP